MLIMLKKTALLFLMVLLLAGCTLGSQWKIKVDLSPEEKQELETKLTEYEDRIKTYQPGDEDFTTPDAPIPYWVDLARAQEDLGQLKNALSTYLKAQKIYPRSQAIENNIGRLYEKAGEYEKAIEQYLYMSEEFQAPQYLYDITKVYIQLKDRKNAEKFFNAWQLGTQRTDEQVQRAIKALRDEEKAGQ